MLWRTVTWGDLRHRVAVLAKAFRKHGLRSGHRVSHISANTSDPIVTFLACLSIGCVFSTLPTDAGAEAIYSRLAQIRPRLVLTDDVAYYNGRLINIMDRVASVTDRLVKDEKVDLDLGQPLIQVICFVNRRDPARVYSQWKGKHVTWWVS